MEFMEVIRKRRSIRKYKPDPVPEEEIKYILEAARLAPSWANTQCWYFVVVSDPTVKEKIGQAGNGNKIVGYVVSHSRFFRVSTTYYYYRGSCHPPVPVPGLSQFLFDCGVGYYHKVPALGISPRRR